MLSNMSETVLSFSQPVTLRRGTQTVVNRKPVIAYVDEPIKATVLTPSEKDLSGLEVKTKLEYKSFHTVVSIAMGDIIVHNGTSFQIVDLWDRQDYGYSKAVGEEIQLEMV